MKEAKINAIRQNKQKINHNKTQQMKQTLKTTTRKQIHKMHEIT